MNDRYGELVQSGLGKTIAKNLGLPTPVALARYEPNQPVLTGEVLLGFGQPSHNNSSHDSNNDTAIRHAVLNFLSQLHAHVATDAITIAHADNFQGVLADSDQKIQDEHSRFGVVIYDASELKNSQDLNKLYDFFHPIARKIKASGRIIIIARPECCTQDIEHSMAQRALLGFVKSIAKEFKKGISANIIYVKRGLEAHLDNSLRFFASPKSAYVSGQPIYLLNDAPAPSPITNDKPLQGKKILVTGASRGIGAAISEVLARDGAYVICVDLPAGLIDLQKQAGKIGAKALPLDITEPNAGQKIIEAVGVLDGIVHNAGITQDKTLANMNEDKWQAVIAVNLQAIVQINKQLLAHNGLADNARIVCVSSIAGIAGNVGQTNYATSKAGVIGLTTATAAALAGTHRTINAVAPGFIETKMTTTIPFALREAGRRMNAMSQGGEPVDVAETIAWLLGSTGAINGNVVRVCGLSVLGA